MNKHTAELLEKHFDTAFAAPDGIKKLRELILALAMQGKLVPQDPNDQPAKELLQEIEAEKQRLVKEGKIKMPKPLLSVTEEEKPYVLPQGWEWVRFGEIAQHNSGKTLDGGRNTGLPRKYITTSNVYWGKFQLNNVREMLIREDELDKCSARKGDLLICEGGEAGRAAVWELPEEICFQNHVHRARLYKDVNPYFAYRFFEKINASGEINNYRKGVGISNMSSKALASIAFPLPPISEQHRIVAKIDELMARCDELEKLRNAQQGARLTVHAAAIKQLLNIAEPDQHQRAQAFLAEHFGELYTVKENVAELRKAILQLAVMGKLVPQNPSDQPASELLRKINTVKRTLEEKEGLRTSAAPFVSQSEEIYGKPEGWSYCRLGNIGKFIDYRGKTPTKVEIGVPLITAKNVRFGYINREPKEYLTPEEYIRWMTRGFPRVGDILFTTEAPLGNIAIIDIEEKFALAQRVICLQLHMPEIATWLKNFMMSDSFQERLLLEATGMTATGIKASKLKEMPVPIPPLEEQYRIVAKVDQVMALCDSLDQHIDAAITKQAELLSAVVAQV
ncbi:restriction endonuclease subunit S [Alcaligenes faecalis]|uniref:restriction endonuclease subunit S n=1 Tax=Alcaligenes faecalis TaxID=511 RepID=UPI000F0B379E|nr:restriction endonuclease subunit S [Alcaligenes faecalis]AYR21454.1 restriction endonuclease subunit S [Alcaligenes faecalis]